MRVVISPSEETTLSSGGRGVARRPKGGTTRSRPPRMRGCAVDAGNRACAVSSGGKRSAGGVSYCCRRVSMAWSMSRDGVRRGTLRMRRWSR